MREGAYNETPELMGLALQLDAFAFGSFTYHFEGLLKTRLKLLLATAGNLVPMRGNTLRGLFVFTQPHALALHNLGNRK